MLYGFGEGNMKERDHLGDPSVDGRIILRWIFRKWGMGVWGYGLDRAGSGWGKVAGNRDCGNELSDSIKCREILD